MNRSEGSAPTRADHPQPGRLLVAEVKRLAWRRLTWVTTVAVALGTVGLGWALHPPGAADVLDAPTSAVELVAWLFVGALAAAFGACLVGASAIGAELRSGSLSQWLTFVPDRSGAYAAKLAAVAAYAAVLGTLVPLASVGAGALLVVVDGGRWQVSGLDAPMVLRCLLLVVAAGVAGFAVAALAGRTAAAPAALGAWLTLAAAPSVVGVRTSAVPVLLDPGWLVATWLVGQDLGRTPAPPWPVAGVVLAGATVAVAALSWVRFTRRDVT